MAGCVRFLLALALLTMFQIGCALEESGVCIDDIQFPSEPENVITFGDFEAHKPLVQSALEQSGLGFLTTGCICTEDIPMTPVYQNLPAEFDNEVYDDNSCIVPCNNALAAFGNLPGSNRFVTTLEVVDSPNPPLGTMAITLFEFPVTTQAPNLRFYLAFNGTVPAKGFIVFARVIDLGIVGDEGIVYNISKVFVGTNDDHDCNNTEWARYTMSLEGLFDAPKFLERAQGSVGLTLVLQFFFVDYPSLTLGLDNLELVGPPYEGEYKEVEFNISRTFSSFPISFIGDGPVDAFFTITTWTYLAATLLCVVIFAFIKSDRGYKVQKAVVFSWYLVGFAVAIYAITEYLSFRQDIAGLREEIDAYILELIGAFTTDLVDTRILSEQLNGVPFGFFTLVLPALTPSKLQQVFEFPPGLVGACQEFSISGVECVASKEEFFNQITTTAGYTSLAIEGVVQPTTDHFLVILLVSLIADVVVGTFLALRLVFDSMLDEKKRRWIRIVETVLAGTNFIIVVAVLAFSLTEPIQYEYNLNLVENTAGKAMSVVPIEEDLSSNGELVIDSSAFGITQTCFTGFTSFNEGLTLLSVAGLFEIFEPTRPGTEFETCNSNDVAWEFNATTACATFDCSSGVVPIITEEAVKPIYDFVFARVIIGVVLIDFLISLIDLCVLPIVYRIEKQLLKEGEGKDMDIKMNEVAVQDEEFEEAMDEIS